MDRSLDDIVSERQERAPRGRRNGRRNDRKDFPRDGIRKSTREEIPRNIDSEWVHDKFDDRSSRRQPRGGNRYSPDLISRDHGSSKLRVDNLHYDLTEDDLDDLFNRIGPVIKLALSYDRAGRSNGTAYITYESPSDAKRAVREFDGANANGQPIRLTLIPDGPARSRNPFDTAVAPPRSLADRITLAPGAARSRSDSPIRHSDVSGPPPANVDRYIPGQGSRSRSPMPPRREGRRPGARRDRGGERGDRGGRGKEGLARDGRPRKTQEELDAEMEDYWGAKENGTTETNVEPEGDIEMAE